MKILESIYLSITVNVPKSSSTLKLTQLYFFYFMNLHKVQTNISFFASKMYTFITKYRKKNQLLMFLAILLNARVKQHDMPIIRVLIKKSVFIHWHWPAAKHRRAIHSITTQCSLMNWKLIKSDFSSLLASVLDEIYCPAFDCINTCPVHSVVILENENVYNYYCMIVVRIYHICI